METLLMTMRLVPSTLACMISPSFTIRKVSQFQWRTTRHISCSKQKKVDVAVRPWLIRLNFQRKGILKDQEVVRGALIYVDREYATEIVQRGLKLVIMGSQA